MSDIMSYDDDKTKPIVVPLDNLFHMDWYKKLYLYDIYYELKNY